MKADARFAIAKVPAEREFITQLMLTVSSEKPKNHTPVPLNLAVVLDCSGSMDGEKIKYVKRAAKSVLSKLGENDIFSLTTFNEHVTPLIPPLAGSNTKGSRAIIENINADGTTFLSGGYEQGRKFAEISRNKNTVSRVMLLTDGQANVGIASPQELAEISGDMRKQGIMTTTVGVGEGYNEELLGAMAGNGGGSAFYIENPNEAEEVFLEEISSLRSLAAVSLEVGFKPSKSVLSVEQLHSYPVIDDRYFLGDVYHGHPKRLILELTVKARKSGILQAGKFELRYKNVSKGSVTLKTLAVPVSLEAVSANKFDKSKADREVTLQAAYLAVARAKKQARMLADKREFDDAAVELRYIASILEDMALNDQIIDMHIRELRQRAQGLERGREIFYSSIEQKRMFHESDMMLKGKPAMYSTMMSRRAKTTST